MTKQRRIAVLKEQGRKEEFSQEVTPTLPRKVLPFKKREENIEKGSSSGFVGIIFSVLSLFLLPYLFAPLGIITGYLAYRGLNRSLGMWAIGLGIIGLLGTAIVSIFMY